ncbi:very short patch repair endonuclease [Piscinibacterium candidicorallinum]|uniref:Very short patch repair endonuclease n=1 Tax=Piscinibacterium candidicorallinum TaxID=1793872 RepID=A0ABV7H3A8_9BURK
MVDVVDPHTRSRMMGAIRGKDTAPELLVRRALHRMGLRFRLGGCGLPGRPDIVLPRHRAVVFVHGCFWHRHQGCARCTTPATNSDFWQRKFARNIERDGEVQRLLVIRGWRVFVVWECELADERGLIDLFWLIRAGTPGTPSAACD